MVLKTGFFLSFLRCKDKQIHWYMEVISAFFIEGLRVDLPDGVRVV